MKNSALEYNLNQGFTIGEIKKTETVLGRCPVTGTWDSDLVALLKKWQKKNGIKVDGKIWRSPKSNTWPGILAAFEGVEETSNVTGAEVKVGAWIDDAAGLVLTSDYVDALNAIGITEAALMVNKANTAEDDPPWKLRWKREQIVTAAEMFREAGIEVVLTVWPRPEPGQIDQMCATLEKLVAAVEVTAIDMDAEGNWTERFVHGFQSIDQASLYLHDKLRKLAPAARLELTTYPFHPELKAAPSLSRLVDVITPQAYSRYNKGEEKYGWNETLGPWGMQQLALTRAGSVASENPHRPLLVCGLAAWDQTFPDFPPEEVMQRALDAAVSLGVDHVRYWSSKWIVGKKANEYSARFIKEIPKASSIPATPEDNTGETALPEISPVRVPIFDVSDLHGGSPSKCKLENGRVVVRDPDAVTGIVIHQTACTFGVAKYQIEEAGGDRDEALRRRALNVACHALAFRNGWVVQPHKLRWHVNHANRFNAATLGLEIEGRYPGLTRKPNQTTWGGEPTPITDTVVNAAREAIRYLVEEAEKEGMTIQYIYAHRQSSPSRSNDPGEALWRHVVLEYAVPVLGLKTDPALVLDTSKGPGRPIPKDWDPNGLGRF
jgi:hypothetical protein